MQDTFAKNIKGHGLTYPARNPKKRLDYILCNQEIQALQCCTISSDASDHLPLVAKILISTSMKKALTNSL
jgi:endonuclease/exonuclease/phosphatase family metal-dependent hydrolase